MPEHNTLLAGTPPLSLLVCYGNERVSLTQGSNVLDALLGAGVDAPHSCRAGVCGSCLARVEEGTIPEGAQEGLSEEARSLRHVLLCRTRPTTDMVFKPCDAFASFETLVVGQDRLAHDVVRLRLALPPQFTWIPGQFAFLSFAADNGTRIERCYSFANLPADGYAEFHVRLVPGGEFSTCVSGQADRKGTTIGLRGPGGRCVYAQGVSGRASERLVLAGVGTGLAPLLSIAREALLSGAREVLLLHGGRDATRLYGWSECETLAAAHSHFRHEKWILEGEAPGAQRGSLAERVLKAVGEGGGVRLFLCGDPLFVENTRRGAFLAGVPSSAIHADAFLPHVPFKAPRT